MCIRASSNASSLFASGPLLGADGLAGRAVAWFGAEGLVPVLLRLGAEPVSTISADDCLTRVITGTVVACAVDEAVGMYRVDAIQIERALGNLIENAQRYSAPEPVTVSLRQDRGAAVVRIVDRGPGIDGDDLDRIFDPFVRLSEADDHQGSGLGLAIARGFIEVNGGTLRAESLPGQGSSFVIEIPPEAQPPEVFSPLRQLFYEAVEEKSRVEMPKAFLAAGLQRRQKVFRLIKESDESDGEVRITASIDRMRSGNGRRSKSSRS